MIKINALYEKINFLFLPLNTRNLGLICTILQSELPQLEDDSLNNKH